MIFRHMNGFNCLMSKLRKSFLFLPFFFFLVLVVLLYLVLAALSNWSICATTFAPEALRHFMIWKSFCFHWFFLKILFFLSPPSILYISTYYLIEHNHFFPHVCFEFSKHNKWKKRINNKMKITHKRVYMYLLNCSSVLLTIGNFRSRG